MSSKQIEVVSPSDEEFESIKNNVTAKETYKIDYNELAKAYNAAKVGSIVLLEAGVSVRANNLITVITGRSLKYKKDFTAGKVMKDASGNSIPPSDRPIAIEKLTKKEMGLVGE